MLYAQITPKELKQIADPKTNAKNISWYQYLPIIQLSSKGQSVTELIDRLGQCTETRSDSIKSYNQGGRAGLKASRVVKPPLQFPSLSHDLTLVPTHRRHCH